MNETLFYNLLRLAVIIGLFIILIFILVELVGIFVEDFLKKSCSDSLQEQIDDLYAKLHEFEVHYSSELSLICDEVSALNDEVF